MLLCVGLGRAGPARGKAAAPCALGDTAVPGGRLTSQDKKGKKKIHNKPPTAKSQTWQFNTTVRGGGTRVCGAADAAPWLEDPETPNRLQLLTPAAAKAQAGNTEAARIKSTTLEMSPPPQNTHSELRLNLRRTKVEAQC